MRIAAFQFSASDDLRQNHAKITDAIAQAAEQNVRLLAFQECATCGYPPIERADVSDIDFTLLQSLRNATTCTSRSAQSRNEPARYSTQFV